MQWTRPLPRAFRAPASMIADLPRNDPISTTTRIFGLEDNVISLRAWLFDRIVYIPDALVNYRQHESNITNRVPPRQTPQARHRAEHLVRTELLWRREALKVFGPDLELAVRRSWITPSTCEEITRLAKEQFDRYQAMGEWWEVRWVTRLKRFLILIGSGRLKEARWCAPRLLPFRTFISLAAKWTRWRLATRQLVSRTLSSLSPGLLWMVLVIDSGARNLVAF